MEPKPIYGGVVGPDGLLITCLCDALATYEVSLKLQGVTSKRSVCTKHFRTITRASNQPGKHTKLVSYRSYREYDSYLVRMDVWRKRNE